MARRLDRSLAVIGITVLPANMTERIIRGLGTTALLQAINTLYPILLVPVFIYAWGAEGYGRWITLSAVIFYLGMLDLGGQNYIGNLIANAYARGDTKSFERFLTEGLSLFISISLLAFLFLNLALWIPKSLLGPTFPITWDECLVLLFLGMNLLQSIPSGIYVTVYRSTGRLARSAVIGNVVRLTTFFLSLAALLLRVPLSIYALILLLCGLGGTLFIIWDIPRQVPQAGHIKLSMSAAKQGLVHLRGSLSFWLLALARAFSFQGVILVLSAGSVPTTVALYSTHRTSAGLIGYFGSLLMAPVWPELAFAYAKNERGKLTRLALLSIRTVVFWACLGAIILWLVLPIIYPLWTGKQLVLMVELLGLLLLQSILHAGWETSVWSLLATNQTAALTRWAIINAGMTIILSIILTPIWGALGVAFACLISDVICGLGVYPRLAATVIGVPSIQVYDAIFRPLVFFAPILLALFSFTPFAPNSVWAIVYTILICAVGITAFLYVFKRDERAWLGRIVGTFASAITKR